MQNSLHLNGTQRRCFVFFALLAIVAVTLLSFFTVSSVSAAKVSHSSLITPDLAIKRMRIPFKGDLPALRKRRYIRVLVAYSKSNFFIPF